ncbi:hypothetical protein [Salinimicrobium sp. HB62]|uniref:hypothetical protein n=1 Tax=Salinimicrobium sp. HB62 TaxID=3077781 RepID=UPI002D79B581|nr:hypothetical protein [Salinimicrobium sp. HB62]
MKLKWILLLLCTFSLACNSDAIKTEKAEESFTISNSENLEFLLSPGIPIEGGFSIYEQAEHFEVSEIQIKDKGVVYLYTPEAGFTGTDIVKIKREDSNGAEIYAQTITTIKINVTE